MKAEHRRDLHTNLLADRMGRLVQGMRSSPKTTSVLVWAFIVLAVGTYVFWQYAASATQTERSALWEQLDEASHNPATGGPKALADLAHEHRGSIPARTAEFERARLSFQQGQAGLTSHAREYAVGQLEQARDLYAKLAKECADSPLLRQEALMGVAKAKESLVGLATPDDPKKDLEDALAAYRDLAALLKDHPDSFLARAAAERAQEIEANLSGVEGFYAELKQLAGPKPLPEPAPKDTKKDTKSGP